MWKCERHDCEDALTNETVFLAGKVTRQSLVSLKVLNHVRNHLLLLPSHQRKITYYLDCKTYFSIPRLICLAGAAGHNKKYYVCRSLL